MKKLLIIAITACSVSAYALPTYEPFTEYSSLVTAGGGSYDLATSGAYVTNGPVVEQWGGGSSGFGLFFSQGTPTGAKYVDVLVTNYAASPFTAANLATILPSGFPGAGSDIFLSAYLPTNSGAGSAGNSAVLKFDHDIPRPTNGVQTLYVSYLITCPGAGAAVGAGNVGRYLGFLSQTNVYEGKTNGVSVGGAYDYWTNLFNKYSATGPNYVSYGQKINSPAIAGGGNDILAADSSGANSPSSGNAGVGINYGTANFVVGCFTFSANMNDTNTVWVNPPVSNFGGAIPSASNFNSYKMTTVMSDVGALFLESRSGGSLGGISPTFIGNLLIGTTWSYVTGGPEFTNQPTSVHGSVGGTITFNGDAVAAAQSVTYHWQHIFGSVTNVLTDGVGTAGGGATVSGSGTDTLTLTGVTAGDISGSYQLAATASGTGFSLDSQLANVITDPFIDSNPTNAVTSYGGTAVFSATAETLQPTMSYQWYLGSTPLVDGLQVDGSTVTGSSGTFAGASFTTTLLLSNVTFSENGSYSVKVTNNVNNSVQSTAATLTVNATAPIISNQLPLAYTNQLWLLAGASPTLSITAAGALPIYYQWFSNNVAISGATDSSLTLANVQTGNSGAYYCLASNFVGGSYSATQTVSVLTTVAPYPLSVMAQNPVGYWRLNESPDNGNGNQYAVCFDYAKGDNGLYTNVVLAQPGYNPATDPSETSALFGSFSSVNGYAGKITGVDFSKSSGMSACFSVEAWENGSPESSDATVVSKESYGNGGEQFVLDVHSGVYRFFVRDASGIAYAVSSAVSPSYGQWHHLAGVCDESNGVVAFYVDGELAGSKFIASGSGILAVTNPMTIGSRMSGTNPTNDDQLHGNVNDVAVFGSALSASQVADQYLAAGIPPEFVQAPAASVAVNENGTLIVPAVVTGTPPLDYQWFDANTALPVAGQTNQTLTISNILSTDSYYLTVTNSFGSTNSGIVAVTLASGAPVIIQDLKPVVTTLAGRIYTYSVKVQGTEPFTYTWYRNAGQIAGQTGSTYTFAAVSGNYDVAVSNVYGGVISTTSSMTAVTNLTDAYGSAILGMKPVGYWPLQELSAPAMANMETNYGTLGTIGTAYYAGTNAPNVSFSQGGALNASGDNDSSVGFAGGNTNSYLIVPLKSSALDLHPPLTLECWIDSTSGTLADLIGDAGANGDGSGTWSGIRMSYNPGFSGGPTLTAYTYAPGSGAGGYTQINASANSISLGSWNHCVVSYDGTNLLLYVNGTLQGSAVASMAINRWSPITIGTGRWSVGPTRGYSGLLDEAAVYTNVLTPTQISNHYLAAITSGSNYMQTVVNDGPLLYYRMDNTFIVPDPTSYPAAVNYGTAPVDGVYDSGVIPGGVPGPQAFGTTELAAPINGVFSCVDAGNDPTFNPAGTKPFTAMTWLRTYPSDVRNQTIMSQGNNWSINLNTTTAGGQVSWNISNGAQVLSTNNFNDGQWHMIAGVYDGATSYLYVDGALNNSTPTPGTLSGEPGANLLLGGNTDNTFAMSLFGSQYFAGALAQSAFFTNALTGSQISQLYKTATTPTISLSHSGGQIIITYSGTLLSSTNVTGPYTPVAGATASPFVVTPNQKAAFYQTSNP